VAVFFSARPYLPLGILAIPETHFFKKFIKLDFVFSASFRLFTLAQ
jgi:hypothetical protein